MFESTRGISQPIKMETLAFFPSLMQEYLTFPCVNGINGSLTILFNCQKENERGRGST